MQNKTRQAANLLGQVMEWKRNQGFAIRMAEIPNYKDQILWELDRLEHYSSRYGEELACLSKGIRTRIWKDNSKDLANTLVLINDVFETLTDSIPSDVFWSEEAILKYVDLMAHCRESLGVFDDETFEDIKEDILATSIRKLIEEKWDNILEAEDGGKAFLDVFDDLFKKAIEKYSDLFICSLEDTDVLFRMVKEQSCDEARFIPWPNKVQNRWNPPGKTFLYLSYGKEKTKYSDELSLEEYVCILECRTQPNTDVCLCQFKPEKKGRVLDLSYNKVSLTGIKTELTDYERDRVQALYKLISNDENIIKKKDDAEFIKKEIARVVMEDPIDRELLEKNYARQILKTICSCIYKKVDEPTEAGKEKAYRSFHILADYLEKQEITGIIYPCTRLRKIKGTNVVLFDKDDAKPIEGSVRQYHYEG